MSRKCDQTRRIVQWFFNVGAPSQRVSLTSALLNSGGSMGEGGVTPRESGISRDGVDGATGHKPQVMAFALIKPK